MNTTIKKITARQILDCKTRPMLEVDVYTEGGAVGRGSAPTGTSVGMYEAFVLRDNDPLDYKGMSVHTAVKNVQEIIGPALIGMDVEDQEAIDQKMIEMDGTPNKSKLGGNTIYSVSVACLRAAAAAKQMPVYRHLAGGNLKIIPLPTFNVVNGGHNGEIIQPFNEFIFVPIGASCVEEAVSMGVSVFQELKTVIRTYLGGAEPLVGGSYGWGAPSEDPQVVLELMSQAAEQCGFAGKYAFALDCASSEMYEEETNTYWLHGQRVPNTEIISCVKALTEKFPLVFVEDMLGENDWEGFAQAHREITRTNLIGDDLIVTNLERLEHAISLNAIDGFILKPNQVGTVSEALKTYCYAKSKGLMAIPSGRAGGAVDDVVADIALALQGPISKNGAPRSGERLNKINSLLRAADVNEGSRLADFSSLIRYQ